MDVTLWRFAAVISWQMMHRSKFVGPKKFTSPKQIFSSMVYDFEWISRLVRSDLKREKINALNIFISGRSCTTKLKIYLTLINSLYYCGITHFHSSRACNCLINYGNAATYSMSPGMEISSKACPLSSFILYTFDKGKVNLQLFYLG